MRCPAPIFTVAAMATVIIGSIVAGRSTDAEPNDEDLITVRVEDIPRKVQLIGRCGQPLGSLLTIRGKWFRPEGRVKDDSERFRIEFVNGQKLETETEFHKFQVDPIRPGPPGHDGGRTGKQGESWDWRYAPNGKASDPAPTPSGGERWEILAVETASFEGYSEEVWRAIGTVPAQAPMGLGATRLEFIAVRRVVEK